MATTMLSDEMVTTNPMKSNAAAGGNGGGGGSGGAASKALAFGAGALARFSTAATQMTGEGLVEYAIFMDPKSLTKIPSAKGFWGKCAQMICTCVGGYENNRLKHLKSSIFPKLDGPVYIYDINSKEGDTFVCLNDRDTNSAGVRRAVRVAGGLFQRNVLYKLLAKEQTLVPASDWAEEHERSEINEILTLLQLTGAIAVNFEHGPSSVTSSTCPSRRRAPAHLPSYRPTPAASSRCSRARPRPPRDPRPRARPSAARRAAR